MTPEEQKFATPRVAAGVLFRDEAGRVLLVKPTYKDGWDLPGGYVEIGESPKQAAIREVREELGVAWPVGKLLVVDWAPHPDEGDKLLFIFEGGLVQNDVMHLRGAAPSEIEDVGLHAATNLDNLMPPRLARRVRAACLDPFGDVYLEHGETLRNSEPHQ